MFFPRSAQNSPKADNYPLDPEGEVLWEWDRMQGGAAAKQPTGEKAPLRNKNTNAGILSNCCCWCLVILTFLTACLLFICLFLLHHMK